MLCRCLYSVPKVDTLYRHLTSKTMKKRFVQSPEPHGVCTGRTGHFSCSHFQSFLQGFSYLLSLFPAFLSWNSIADLAFLPAKPCQLDSSSDTLSSSNLHFYFFLKFTGKNFYPVLFLHVFI